MRVAILARTLDDSDGVGVANRNLIDRIIQLDRETDYVVLYKTRRHLGRYENYSNVKEVVSATKNKILWDQVAVPYYARKEGVNLIFQPKFTVPLLTKIPTVAFCRGAEYFSFPEYFGLPELIYARASFPRYYRKATKILTLSDHLQDDLHRYLKVPYDKMETVHSAPDDYFFPRKNSAELGAFRQKYQLPEEFILSVTRPYYGKRLHPRKNIDNILKSFISLWEKHPQLNLVFAGGDCHRYISTVFGREMADDGRLHYHEWIPQVEIPYLYSLARLLVFPSYYEGFGLPIVEAMACGCPVVTSTSQACPEVAGDAGILVDPTDVGGISEAMDRILTDPGLSRTLSEKGLKRASEFSWTQSAEKVIGIFKEIVSR